MPHEPQDPTTKDTAKILELVTSKKPKPPSVDNSHLVVACVCGSISFNLKPEGVVVCERCPRTQPFTWGQP